MKIETVKVDVPENCNVLLGTVHFIKTVEAIYEALVNAVLGIKFSIGAYLDGRNRICWLIPLLILTFMLNVLICTKAFIDLGFSRITGKKRHPWLKTVHNGNGNRYIR